MEKAGILLTLEFFGLCLILSPALAVSGENASQYEAPDAFLLFSEFTEAAAVKDVNQDPMFKCLRTIRTEYNSETPSATYDWSLNVGADKPRKHVAVQYSSGDAPEIFFTTINSDPSTRAGARFLYTDYKTCAVTVMDAFGYLCTLWIDYEKRYSYPEYCDKMHAELCGEAVSLFDKELCNDA